MAMISPKSMAITRSTSCMNSRSLCSMIRIVRPSLRCSLRIERRQRLDLAGAEPGKGFVEQQQFRLGRKRARDLEPAQVAVWQDVDQELRLVAEADLVEPCAARASRGLSGVAHPRCEAGDLHVLQHGHAHERARELEGARQAAVDDPVGAAGRASDWPSRSHAAGIRRNEPGEQVEQRGLAGAVRAEHAGDRAAARNAKDTSLTACRPPNCLFSPSTCKQCRHGSIRRMRCHAGAISPCGMKNRMKTSRSV